MSNEDVMRVVEEMRAFNDAEVLPDPALIDEWADRLEQAAEEP